MRGFLLGAAILVGLQIALRAPSSALAAAAAVPAAWAEKWMSPATPLITKPVPGSGGGTGSPAKSGSGTNSLGESTTGQCPPGFPKGLKCLEA
jgi:hypothetical protein